MLSNSSQYTFEQLNPDIDHVPTKTTRLSIPYFLYSQSSHRAIKQLLGQDITIISETPNNIISEDDHIFVDVTYSSIPLSTLRIYYIPTSSLKKLIPNGEKYVITINNCNVKISSPRLKDFPSVIPIRLKSTLSNNFTDAGQSELQFAYYGLTVTNPLSTFITPVKYPNHASSPFTLETISPIYPSSFTSQIQSYLSQNKDSLLEETLKYYRQSLSNFNLLSFIDHIESTSNFSDIKMGTTAYIIPFDIVPLDRSHKAIILIQARRLPSYILYFPTNNFTITEEEINSIHHLIQQDIINFNNFHYLKTVLNASNKV